MTTEQDACASGCAARRGGHRAQLGAFARALLQKLVETAAELTGARYAALGVIDRTRSGLERFVTTGVDEATRREIGDPPHGRGILGVLVRDATPLRLHDIADDPRSVGLPPGHPPMKSFLGVPCSSVTLPMATSTSARSSTAATSPTRTRSSSACSPRRLRSRSRTHASTSPLRAGRGSSSR